jgi:hypothetical protein
MGAERRLLSCGDDEDGGQLGSEHAPDDPVGNVGECLPAAGVNVRLDDQDWNERERRHEDKGLERRVDATRLVLRPHERRVRFGQYRPCEMAQRVEHRRPGEHRHPGRYTEYVRISDAGEKRTFRFCPDCGATVFWTTDGWPDSIAVPIGAFADPSFPQPTVSVYGLRRYPWLSLPDGIEEEYD